MTYQATVILSFDGEDDEDETLNFVIDLRFIPRIGDCLTFEAHTSDDRMDVLSMCVIGVEECFYFIEDVSKSVAKLEIEAVLHDDPVLQERPSGEELRKVLERHSVVQSVEYPV